MDASTMIMLKRYEEKLKELMTEEEYFEFSKSVAKEAFFNELSRLPEGDFKDFALDNFQHITAEPDEFLEWMAGMEEDKRDCENCKNYKTLSSDSPIKSCCKWECEFEQAESEGEDE